MNKVDLKKSIPGTRLILYVASFLVLSVAISLYFLSEKTDLYFSWTIYPPLSAAFLGAGYLASFVLELLSARETIWARARPAVPGVWVFTFLTLIITLLHLDRFHFDSPSIITRAGTWVWLGVYVSVPIAMWILWLLQARRPGVDPPRSAPLPRWLRGILILQGSIMLLVGGSMILFPKTMTPIWPWILYPLSAASHRRLGDGNQRDCAAGSMGERLVAAVPLDAELCPVRSLAAHQPAALPSRARLVSLLGWSLHQLYGERSVGGRLWNLESLVSPAGSHRRPPCKSSIGPCARFTGRSIPAPG